LAKISLPSAEQFLYKESSQKKTQTGKREGKRRLNLSGKKKKKEKTTRQAAARRGTRGEVKPNRRKTGGFESHESRKGEGDGAIRRLHLELYRSPERTRKPFALRKHLYSAKIET